MNDINAPEPTSYEPPAIETVLEEEDLEREVLYAGGSSQVP